MGTWGAAPFDNDAAADWAYGFEGLDCPAGIELLEAAFAAAAQADYLKAPDGAIAVAAAQVVVWLLAGHESGASSYSSDPVAWTRRCPGQPDPGIADRARAALRRVRSGTSELAKLWDDDDAWQLELTRIYNILGHV